MNKSIPVDKVDLLYNKNISLQDSSNNVKVDVLENCNSPNVCTTANPCYCFLSPNIKLYKTRFAPEEEKEIINLDHRDKISTFVDVFNIINGQYPPEFKKAVDEILCRNCAYKVTDEENILKTNSDIKQLRKTFMKQQMTDKEKKTFEFCQEKLSIRNPLHPYNEKNICQDGALAAVYKSMKEQKAATVLLNFNSSHLSNLPATMVFCQYEGREPVETEICVDTGSSHLAMSLKQMKKMNIQRKDIMTDVQFSLNSSSQSNQNNIILGYVEIFLYFQDMNTNRFYKIPFDCIILNNDCLPAMLLPISLLRKYSFTLQHHDNQDVLTLQLPGDGEDTVTPLPTGPASPSPDNNVNMAPTQDTVMIRLHDLGHPPPYQHEDTDRSSSSSHKCGTHHTFNSMLASIDSYINTIESNDGELIENPVGEIHAEFLEDETFNRNKLISTNFDDQNDEYMRPDFTNCTAEEIVKIKELLARYSDCIARDRYDVGEFKNWTVDVNIKPGAKVYDRERPMKESHKIIVDEYIKNFMERGIICYADKNSRFNCNILVQEKTKGKKLTSLADKFYHKQQMKRNPNSDPEKVTRQHRLILDLRTINAASVPEAQAQFEPLYSMNFRAHGRVAFVCDFSHYYFNLKISEHCKHTFVFSHRGRRYSLLRTPQGWLNSQIWSNRAAAEIFGLDVLQEFQAQHPEFDPAHFLRSKLQYSDDCLLLGNDSTELLLHVECLLFCLCKSGIKVGLHKIKWCVTSFNFLSNKYDLSNRTMCVNSDRLNTILSWSYPSTPYLLLSRLCTMGFLGQYAPALKLCSFILYYALRTNTLTWSECQQKAWNNCKLVLELCNTLALPQQSDTLVISTDASAIGFASQLSRYDKDTNEFQLCHVVQQLFPKNVLNRHATALELLALSKCLNAFSYHIENSDNHVYILSDLLCLKYLSTNSSNVNIHNLGMQLSSLMRNCSLITIPSLANGISDNLSKNMIRYCAERGLTQQVLSLINHNINLPAKTVLDYEDIMKLVNTFSKDLELIDCNVKTKYKPSLHNFPLMDLCSTFKTPSEIEFLKVGRGQISNLCREHALWRGLKAKLYTDQDVERLREKYGITEGHCQALNLLNHIKEDSSASQCLQFYPEQSKVFIDQVMKIAKLVGNKKLCSFLQYYDSRPPALQLDILHIAKVYFEKYSNEHFNDNFVYLSPVAILDTSQVVIKPHHDGLAVFLKNPLKIVKSEIMDIRLHFLVVDNNDFLYLTPTSNLSSIHNTAPVSYKLPHHLFDSVKWLATKTMLVTNEAPIYYIQGMTPRVDVHRQSSPVTLKCVKGEPSECRITVSQGFQKKIILHIPIFLKPGYLENIFQRMNSYTHSPDSSDLIPLLYKHFQDDNVQTDSTGLDEVKLMINTIKFPEEKKSLKKKISKKSQFLRCVNDLVLLSSLLNTKEFSPSVLRKLFSVDKQYSSLMDKVNKTKDPNYTIIKGLLFKVKFCEISKVNIKTLVLSASLARAILTHYHNILLPHFNPSKIVEVFNRSFHHPQAQVIAKDLQANCLQCSLGRVEKVHRHSGNVRTIQPVEVWCHIELDCAESLPETSRSNTALCVMVCSSSSYSTGVAIRDTSAQSLLFAFFTICGIIGYPSSVGLDHSSANKSSIFQDTLKKLGINIYSRQAQHSKSQSHSENFIKNTKNHLKRIIMNPSNPEMRRDWDLYIGSFLAAWNNISVGGSRLSRNQLFHSSNKYQHFGGGFIASTDQSDEVSFKFLEKLQQRRILAATKNKRLNNSPIKPGAVVLRLHTEKKQLPTEGSKYLLPSGDLYLLLTVDCLSVKGRRFLDGAIHTFAMASCRPITTSELLYNCPPTNFSSILDTSSNVRGSNNNPQFISEHLASSYLPMPLSLAADIEESGVTSSLIGQHDKGQSRIRSLSPAKDDKPDKEDCHTDHDIIGPPVRPPDWQPDNAKSVTFNPAVKVRHYSYSRHKYLFQDDSVNIKEGNVSVKTFISFLTPGDMSHREYSLFRNIHIK